MFETAKCITDTRFRETVPLNVFHREKERPVIPHNKELENRHILFRRHVTLGAMPQSAVLSVSADDYYKLYVNGIFVTQGPAPGYPFHYYFNAVDITPYLHTGDNVIAVHTYYQGLINRVWVSGDERQMFICQLDADGKTVLVSDETWKTAEHTGYSRIRDARFGYDTQFAEDYDSRSPEDGFMRPDYDDSTWDYAVRKENTDYTFFLQPTKQLDIYTVSPARIVRTKQPDGTVLIFGDIGYEAVGALCLMAAGSRGSRIVIRCGEEPLTDENGKPLDRVRYEMRCNCVYEEYWTLSGGTDTLVPYDYKGFRYFELLLPKDCTVSDADIRMQIRHYPYTPVLPCPTEDAQLQKIWKLCEDTIRYSVQEVYMDCPTREKGQYLGDGSVSSAAHVLLTGDGAMMKKALYEYARSTFITDGIMTVAPSSLMQEIADYSMQYPMQLLWYYRHTGEKDVLYELAPYAERAVAYFKRFDRGDGLLEGVDTWNLIDWPENLRDNYDFPATNPIGWGAHNVINAFWYGMLRDTDTIRLLLGKTPDSGYTEQVGAAFVKEFYDAEQHLFTDAKATAHTSAHANLLPLYFGLEALTGDEKTTETIVALLRKKGLCMGVYMSYFLLAALKRAGAEDAVRALLLSPDGWLNMIAEGATTTLEAWGRDKKWNTSFMHPWATAPILILGDGLL